MSIEICKKLADALLKRGFEAEVAANEEEAVSLVMAEAASAVSVGWGGSETVKALGLREKLVESGKAETALCLHSEHMTGQHHQPH